MSDEQTYTITELAREFDITPRAIRFYEDEGLLTPTRVGRARVYSKADRTRLKLTLRGKRLGLSLAEIRELIDMYRGVRDAAPQLERFLSVLALRRAALEQQRIDIEVVLLEIDMLEQQCHALLGQNIEGAEAVRAKFDKHMDSTNGA
jgi:DNA-binding transcriptional MerR regulator